MLREVKESLERSQRMLEALEGRQGRRSTPPPPPPQTSAPHATSPRAPSHTTTLAPPAHAAVPPPAASPATSPATALRASSPTSSSHKASSHGAAPHTSSRPPTLPRHPPGAPSGEAPSNPASISYTRRKTASYDTSYLTPEAAEPRWESGERSAVSMPLAPARIPSEAMTSSLTGEPPTSAQGVEPPWVPEPPPAPSSEGRYALIQPRTSRKR
jgi:hypothetical protein